MRKEDGLMLYKLKGRLKQAYTKVLAEEVKEESHLQLLITNFYRDATSFMQFR